MRLLIALLVLAFSLPVAAQDPKAEKKTEKKAQKKADKKKPPAKKVEKTTAEPKQDWGRFNTQAKKDEKERAQKAAALKK